MADEMKVMKILLKNNCKGIMDKEDSDLSTEYCEEVLPQLRGLLDDLTKLQKAHYLEICNTDGLSEDDIDKQIAGQVELDNEFNDKVKVCIARLSLIVKTAKSQGNPSTAPSNARNSLVKLPELKINNFSDNSSNNFAFFHFQNKFQTTMSSVQGVTPSVKLVYLKSYLEGRALSLIENLPIVDNSYTTAWQLLEEEFLDKDLLINDTLSKIINYKPCLSLESNSDFLIFIKSKTEELSKFNLDFFVNGSPGNVLLSNIIRSKLYGEFYKELCRKLDCNYPNVREIITNATSVTKLLQPREKARVVSLNTNSSKDVPLTNNKTPSVNKNNSYQLKTSSGCKFCQQFNHSSLHCKKYVNFDQRTKRALELNLCNKCLSSGHTQDKCPGNFSKLPFSCKSCHSHRHVTPMCSQMTLAYSSGKNIHDTNGKR